MPSELQPLGELKMHLIRTAATPAQIAEMLETCGHYIKLAVDIERVIVVGGGAMHADCEAALLNDGSRPADVWGADWFPEIQHIEFESFINIKPANVNPARFIMNETIRLRVEQVIRALLETSDE